jgi:DUF4097 and DUF4098 domain-containing protein YvlB
MSTTPFARALLVAALALAAASTAGAAADHRSPRFHAAWMEHFAQQRGPEQTDRVTKTFRVGRTAALELSNISGDIVVTGGPGEEIAIEATKRVRGRDDAEAKQQLSSVSIEAVERGGRVEVRTVYPRMSNNRVSVDYRVTVPAGTSVDVKSVSGDMKVTGVKGDLRAESVSGEVRAETGGQAARVKSVSGDVELTGVSGSGDVNVASVSGDVTAKNIKCRNLDAGSVSGEVRLIDVDCERSQVSSISGSLEYAGPLQKGGRYELKAHSGNVRLALSGTTGFEVDASTFSGTIRTDLPITLKAAGEGRERTRQSLRGTLGDASALVVIKTFSGDVTIAKR